MNLFRKYQFKYVTKYETYFLCIQLSMHGSLTAGIH
jgi:hypothetical protein